MKPYYERGGITIYHGDCREVIPFMRDDFDLLCTDPPYGIGEASGKNKSRGKIAVSRDYGTSDWDNAPAPLWLINQARAKCNNAIIFGGNYYELPPTSCWLVWDKDNGLTDFADCELAWTDLRKATRRLRYRWQGMLQERMGDEKEARYHPTQKPLPVMLWVLEQAPEARTILDPFMGSGTTLVAAKQLGKTAIGIERDERYCEAAALRLSQDILPLEEEPLAA